MSVRWIAAMWTAVAVVMIAALALLWPELPALAQDAEPVRLSALEIALWPEFDRPELLVIFQGRLADDVPLPAVLTLTIPQEAGEPHAVASVDEDSQRLDAQYDLQAAGGAIKVTYTSLEHRTFQLEYYLDALQVKGKRRQFTFRYQLDVPVDDLVLVVQQPSGAASVALNPPAVETYSGFADLTYYRLPLGPVDAGEVVEWQVGYAKSASLIGIVVVVGLVLAVSLWIVGSRRSVSRRRVTKPPRRKKRKDRKGARSRPRSASLARASPPQSAQPAQSAKLEKSRAPSFPSIGFCHQCGTPLKEDALFCHRCGTRRKGT